MVLAIRCADCGGGGRVSAGAAGVCKGCKGSGQKLKNPVPNGNSAAAVIEGPAPKKGGKKKKVHAE